jgi:hypothetical protein
MQLVHSFLNTDFTNPQSGLYEQQKQNTDETSVRFLAYIATRIKYRQQIADIQKYIPGWLPDPPTQ